MIDKKIHFVLKHDWIGVEAAYTFEETQIVYEMVEKFKDKVNGKKVLVVGSETPWVEAIVLAVGAKNVTTLEYNPYPANHPRIITISPIEFSQLVVSNQAPMFDAMVTFSSLEHSGLGRYKYS